MGRGDASSMREQPSCPASTTDFTFEDPGHWQHIPVNPSGGLLACGHPVGATGLMQAVFAFWQLQETIGKHLGDATLQIANAKRGLIHSHAGTGTYITVSILERV